MPPVALSRILSVPVRVPVAVGSKVTLMVQLAPAPTELPQVLVCAKSPLVPMLVMLKEAVPVFLRVTGRAELVVPSPWAGNVKLVADKLTAGAVPVPVRPIDCGLPVALSLMVTVPVRAPVAAGAKVTLIVQLAPAATELPQVWVCAKSPLAVMLVIVKIEVLVFFTVTDCAALVVPSGWLPNVRFGGVKLTVAGGVVPVPVKVID